MATKTKQWSTGTGSATIQYDGQSDDNIIITSDANSLYEARSMQITVETTDGSGIQRVITINQAAKQRIDLSAAVVTAANQTYSGSAKTPTPTVTLNSSTVPSTGYDVAYSNNTNAGTATITVTGKGDYTGTASGTFNIAKATPSYTAPTKRTGLTYSGSSQYLTTSGSTSHGTIYYSTDGSNWYTSRCTGTNAGTYYCYWKLVGDSNHTDISSTYLGTTSIAKASRSLYWSSYPSTLDVGDSASLSAYPSAGSGDGSISFSTSNSSIASVSGSTVYGNNDGSCTIYASISEGTNYLSASTSYTLTVEVYVDPSLYVDLGLPSGRKWAKYNLGAGSETDYGDYFSWGNIDGHGYSDGYSWGTNSTDPYKSSSGKSLTGNIPSNSSYDAARAYMGSPWRMPTASDFEELYNNTTSEFTYIGGRGGWKFTGQNGNYIFLVAGGRGYNASYIAVAGQQGYYWASEKYNTYNAFNLLFTYNGSITPQNLYDKAAGCLIRAVF